jgi:asparagine synthase (glutamine-hydrolysing)
MCGICGAVSLAGGTDERLVDNVGRMCDAIKHRGPDGFGFYRDSHAVLGHRRLAIIDRARGAQPLSNEDGSIWIVFNGEIYNHRALRPRLESRGHRFRTASDTEAIVHAYEEFGVDCLEHLEGMFAFAIYDRPRQQLFIARDRLGKKPLFYADWGGAFYFSSELESLLHAAPAAPEIGREHLQEYFTLGYISAPRTAYKEIHKLEAASWMLIDPARRRGARYWDLTNFEIDRRPEPVILRDLEQLLRTAVSDRLESEVPLGAFLSGGIDSGLVVSWMAETAPDSVRTTSVGFPNGSHNELELAGETARAFHTRHTSALVDTPLLPFLSNVPSAFGEPFADSSALPTFYVSRRARQEVTVALTGDGGDEPFGGYDFRYVPHLFEHRLRGVTDLPPVRPLVRGLAALWPRAAWLPRPLRIGTLLDNLQVDEATAYYRDLCLIKPGLVEAIFHSPVPEYVEAFVTDTYRRPSGADPVQRSQYGDIMVYLPNDVLVKVDRMSMRNSLEVRSPFLDHKVVEFALRLPSELKLKGTKGKYMLRALAEQRLPHSVAHGVKRGFTAPVKDWCTREYAVDFEREVLQSDSVVATFLDQGKLRQMYDQTRTGARDLSSGLWAAWVLQRWLSAGPGRSTAPSSIADLPWTSVGDGKWLYTDATESVGAEPQ